MKSPSKYKFKHSHNFTKEPIDKEASTSRVMILTAVTMAVEIIAGIAFGSMALLADGWHMATHVAAFGITLFAYRYARTNQNNPKFTFGTGKVSILGGFASAVTLAVVALVMALESIVRLLKPQEINFNQAILVAITGLIVNLICGFILGKHHEHDYHHSHEHCDDSVHHSHDHNLRAAYFHVLADAMTSVFAIFALFSGKFFGLIWLDPVMGLVGAVVIAYWAYGLVSESSQILLDSAFDEKTAAAIKNLLEKEPESHITDFHIWHIGPEEFSIAVSIASSTPRQPEYYKDLLEDIPNLAHILVEVNLITREIG